MHYYARTLTCHGNRYAEAHLPLSVCSLARSLTNRTSVDDCMSKQVAIELPSNAMPGSCHVIDSNNYAEAKLSVCCACSSVPTCPRTPVSPGIVRWCLEADAHTLATWGRCCRGKSAPTRTVRGRFAEGSALTEAASLILIVWAGGNMRC